MSAYHPIIGIIGAGAIGGYYGARLAQHGYDVHFLVRSDYDAIRANGLTVKSLDGDFIIPADRVNVYRDPGEMPKVDLAIITTKSTANHALPGLLKPIMKPDTALLTLQNGIGGEDDLAAEFGPDHILGGMAFVCINRVGPGMIHHIDHGIIRLGPFRETARQTAKDVVAMFTASKIRCEELASLNHGRWLKLVWNIPFNGLGTVMDLTTDRLLANDAGRKAVANLMTEVVAAANADGANLPPQTVQQQIDRTPSMGPYKSSMQIDRQMGRPLEIEYIIERPLQIARKYGLKSPNWEHLLKLLQILQ